jgi:hypothetical protein
MVETLEMNVLESLISTINFSRNEKHTPVLCLNMIVKNESKIIVRLLESVLSIVDSYCICDTGSTDDTIQIIRDYMTSNGKNGIVFSEPFQNFGYNRTVALERAKEYGDYALLLDADMKLIIAPEFNKQKSDADSLCSSVICLSNIASTCAELLLGSLFNTL